MTQCWLSVLMENVSLAAKSKAVEHRAFLHLIFLRSQVANQPAEKTSEGRAVRAEAVHKYSYQECAVTVFPSSPREAVESPSVELFQSHVPPALK